MSNMPSEEKIQSEKSRARNFEVRHAFPGQPLILFSIEAVQP